MKELAIFIVPLAICVGLIMWAANMFHLRLDVAKVAVSCVAASATTTLVLLGLLPSLAKWSGGFPMAGQILVMCLALFGTPLLVLAACLAIVANLVTQEAQALALFGWGGVITASGLALLSLTDKISSGYMEIERTRDAGWLLAVLGIVLMLLGHRIGTRLKLTDARTIVPRGGNAPAVILGGGNAVSNDSHIDPMTVQLTQYGSDRRNHPMTQGQNPTIVPTGAMAESAWIVVSAGQDKGRRFDLRPGDMHIGRSRECHIRILGDEEVGRQHALIRVQGQIYELHDMAARNGTYLNEARVTNNRTLQDGDEIRVGKSILTFKRVG